MLVTEGMSVDEDLHPFLFFGCWNRVEKPVGSPRDSVIEAVLRNPIHTVVLGGDNIYPTVTEGSPEKKYRKDLLLEGIGLLASKRVYASLGNHNVKDPAIQAIEIGNPGWTLPSPYYSSYFSDGYALVVLDTNRVEEPEPMIEWLREEIRKLQARDYKYYVVQHEPYASFKKNKIQRLPNATRFLHELLPYPPVAILCADTHNYQKGIIKIGDVEILQYVVGTGGAKPDPIVIDSSHSIDVGEGITYTMVDHKKGYGFLVVDSKSATFEHILPWEAMGGTRRWRRGNKKTRRFKYNRRK